MILDTTFLIDIMQNDNKAALKLQKYIKSGETLLITAPTVFELYSGLVRSSKPLEEKNKILKVLEGQLVIGLDKQSAEKSGEIDGNLVKEGQAIGPIDCMIASVAIEHDIQLLHNDRDFDPIEKHFSLKTVKSGK